MGLTEAQKEFYKENGYIQLSNIFTPEEVEEISQAYDSVFERKKKQEFNMQAGWEGNWLQNGNEQKERKTVLSVHNLQCHNEVFARLMFNRKLVDAVSDCIGSPNVCLHHCKAHVKPPREGSAYPAHQDYLYFPYEKHSMVACFVNVDASDPENGGLAIYPGSHKSGPLPDVADLPEYHYCDPKVFPLEKGVPVRAKKGDVVIFSYLTVHASYPNKSDRSRRMLLYQMMAAEDRPTQSIHISPCHGLVLRGENTERPAEIQQKAEIVVTKYKQ